MDAVRARRARTAPAMIKRTGLAILLGLGGFALGSLVARVMGEGGHRPGATAETPPALRHITQIPPPPAPKAARDVPHSGR
ncbi:hypothetical protein LPC10_18155 [Methylorubrum sp. B1-46]|uniref:hypothetical protein n=1 Tax=Methylorubrum sp. B1-46 TaxID=2897334 RepID=UPI001E4E0F1C|nr:hypothetical protein [Methylorubrum sp. B1-46]UGB24850.1 hypothetical protein LPC10_18155 [Methylorubrum sp. B1-46]